MIDMGDATFFRVGMPVSRSMALHYGLNSGALLEHNKISPTFI